MSVKRKGPRVVAEAGKSAGGNEMTLEKDLWLVRSQDTPLGPLELYASLKGLTALAFVDLEENFNPIIPGLTFSPQDGNPPDQVTRLLNEALSLLYQYFDDPGTSFGDLPLDLKGSVFQVQVWQALRHIPSGTTVTYQELARRLGKPRAFRAVGQACGANPLPLIIPCHRVIAADGSLGGYSSGLARKRWLLEHEGLRR